MKFQKPFIAGLGIAAVILPLALADRHSSVSAKERPLFAFAQVQRREMMVVPAGTKIYIRLLEAISSDQNSSRDTFRAFLDQPITVGRKTLAPFGSKVSGELLAVSHPGPPGAGASLTMVLQKITVDGKKYALDTQPLTLFARQAAALPRNSFAGKISGARPIGREMLAAQTRPVAYGPESRFSFILSRELVLPVYR